MTTNGAIVWVFDSRAEAEASIKKLHRRNCDMSKMSIVGKDHLSKDHCGDFYNFGERMKMWDRFCTFSDGSAGLLCGSAMFVIPGIGPLLVFGPLVASIGEALDGVVVVCGLNAIGAALFSIGIPKDGALQYETALESNKFLVVAHGCAAEVAKAKGILAAPRTAPHAMHELSYKPSPITLVTAAGSTAAG